MIDFSEAWEYFLLLIFGATVVGVHAHAMFGQKLTEKNAENVEDPLSSLSLPVILGRSDFRRGFTVYLLANEMLYLILTSSSTILALVLEAVGHQKMVGALTEDVTPNILYPILASSLVVLMSQTKPTSGIERTFRRIAHGIAGMPRNLEDTQARIRAMDLVNDIDVIKNTNQSLPIVNAAEEKTRIATQVAKKLFTEELEINNFRRSLEKVHCLFCWTLGYDGECIWISEPTRQITSLFQPLELEYFRLCNEIDLLVRLSAGNHLANLRVANSNLEDESQRERWRSVIGSVQLLEQRLCVVISLLLINQPDVDLTRYPALDEVREHVVTKPQPDEPGVADIAWHSVIIGGSFALLSLLCLSVSIDLWREVTRGRLSGIPEFPRLVDMGYFSRLIELPSVFFGKTEKFEYVASMIEDTLIQLTDYSLIFCSCIVIALFVRKSQIDLRRWHVNSSTASPSVVPPVSSYLLVGGVAYVLTTVLYFLWRFLVHNLINPLQDGVDVNLQLSISSFGAYLPDITLETLVVFPCVWFVLSYADRAAWKNGSYADSAIKYALVCSIIVFLQKLIRFDFPSSTSLFEAPASPFIGYLILFVAFARVYELHKESVNQTTVVRRIGNIVRYSWGRIRHTSAEQDSAQQTEVTSQADETVST